MSQNWEGGVPPPSPSLEESPMPSKKGRQHVVGSTAPTQPESATCSAAGRGVNHAAGMGGTSTGVLEHPHGRKDPAPRETSWPRGSQGPLAHVDRGDLSGGARGRAPLGRASPGEDRRGVERRLSSHRTASPHPPSGRPPTRGGAARGEGSGEGEAGRGPG